MVKSFAVLLACALACAAEPAQAEPSEEMAAAIRLKQAHVERFWAECTREATASGSSPTVAESRCRRVLQLYHERELAALRRIGVAVETALGGGDEAGANEINRQTTECYDPGHTYVDLVKCWERLVGRLERAQ